MKLSLVLLVLSLDLILPARGFDPDLRPPTVARTTIYLVSGTIPIVDFEETPLEDALEYMNHVMHAPSNPQFSLAWNLPPEVSQKRLAFSLKSISTMELLERCLEGVEYSLEIKPGKVTINVRGED
jgi:hypothetical protein